MTFPWKDALILSLVLLCCSTQAADSPQHVAPTNALTPQQQQKKFHLPPGFEIQLVASESDIGQPMNLDFDAQGRLWVTHSVEYPYPAAGEGVQRRPARFQSASKKHPPRDRLTVFEGINKHGKPKRITHFASDLNIPIGHTPLGSGNSALVYSIPSIYRVTDTDGDGKSDKRVSVYGKFGNVDTHGMANSFTRWIDGWIYGCHGFSNQSKIKDASGNVTKMKSGNTYRFRADGSQFEQYTWGQVNPFGMTFDQLGNLYDADCHTMPVYMLLRGARYPHFGAPPTKLGFGPKMINHSHGSTGICGPAYYAADHFPKDYRNNLYICNPVTGRVHRDKLQPHGSTLICDTQPDFIRCDDPWFRPVDAIVGPDGALYIADFYNAVIGHYEVPLTHPKRDRTRGRIWRIVYRGSDGKAAPPKAMANLTKLSPEKLIEQLGSENLLVRVLATNYLVDAHSKTAANLVLKSWKTLNATQRAHALWVLERLRTLNDFEVRKIAKSDQSRLVRVHLIKALAERTKYSNVVTNVLNAALTDQDAFVRRAAVDALGRKPKAANVLPLLTLWKKTAKADTHLIHTIRLALQKHLSDKTIALELTKLSLDAEQRKYLIEIALASENAASTSLLLHFIQSSKMETKLFIQAAGEIARFGSKEQVANLIAYSSNRLSTEKTEQVLLLQTIYENVAMRSEKESIAKLKTWAQTLAPSLVLEIEQQGTPWKNHSLKALPPSASPWGLKSRASKDGKNSLMTDSIVNGEQRTGLYRSRPFTLPNKITFWMCGHNGQPPGAPKLVNHIRLVLVKSGKVIAKNYPPRDDTAHQYIWNLKKHAGQKAVLEIIDADSNDAYAWIAVGRFAPAVVSSSQKKPDIQSIKNLEMIGSLGPKTFAPRLVRLINEKKQSPDIRIAAARAALRLGSKYETINNLIAIVKDSTESVSLRGKAAEVLSLAKNNKAQAVLVNVLTQSSANVQQQIALALCLTRQGAKELLQAIRTGKASARLLQNQKIAQRFSIKSTKQMQKEVAELLKGLPSVEKQKLKLIARRLQAFHSANTSPQNGAKVFTKNCAACHQVNNQGKKIGPQLDGVGIRGIARLLEDILDPSRNVDPAFRSTTVVTDEGQIHNGLVLSEKNNVLVLADSLGKKINIAVDGIEQRRNSHESAMPGNMSEQIKEQDFNDLVSYLLLQKSKPANNKEGSTDIKFKKVQLDSKFRSEGVAVADFNHDGKLDIAAGRAYYLAPDWKMHSITKETKEYQPKGYSNSFVNAATDLNGDGWADLMIVDFPGTPTFWYENPKKQGIPWKQHIVTPVSNNESPQYVDLLSNGKKQWGMAVAPTTKTSDGPKRYMAYLTQQTDPTKPWIIHRISKNTAPFTTKYSHGLGIGDINGDGRTDVVVPAGWWERPQKNSKATWKFHAAKFGTEAAHMHVFDIDGDGDADVLSSSPHKYGIWWHEQTKDGWKTHEIDKSFSQTHSMCLADISGDGLPDFVTGKRWYAHGGHDPGGKDPSVFRWYELSRKDGKVSWIPHQFDHNSGIGTQFELADVNQDGLLDIVSSNKKGVFYFQQIKKKNPRK